MADESFPVNNLLRTAKSREAQRAMLAEMRGQRASATLHFLAAAHMELVLAADYESAGDNDLAWRSQISAASCFWRGGDSDQARRLFESLLQKYPARASEIQSILSDLAKSNPALAS